MLMIIIYTSDEYVLIDATNTQDIQTRKVAFVEQYESSPRGPPGLTYNNNSVQRPKSAKARLSRSPERRPRSAKITNRSPRLSSLEARIASLEAGKVRKSCNFEYIELKKHFLKLFTNFFFMLPSNFFTLEGKRMEVTVVIHTGHIECV